MVYYHRSSNGYEPEPNMLSTTLRATFDTFLRLVVLLPLLHRRWARQTARRFRVCPTPLTASRRITPGPWMTVIRRALLNTHPLLMLQRDHT